MAQNVLFLLKKMGVKTLVCLLNGLIYLQKILIFILTWTVARPLYWIATTVLFSFAVKIYKLCLFSKIRWWDKIYAPIKIKIIYPLTRRYITHTVIIILTIFSVTTNIMAREAPLENIEQIGQKSILYALSYDENSENYFLQEESEIGEVKILSYLGSEANVSSQPNPAGNEEDNSSILTTGDDSALLNPNLPSTSANQRAKIAEYKVGEGDTATSIAEKFDLAVNTILWANNLGEHDLIRPGDKLLILPVNGVLHKVKKNDTVQKIAQYYKAESEKIIAFNALAGGSDLVVGESLIIPEGKVPSPPAPIQIRSRLSARNAVKIPSARSQGAGMVWPTGSKRITQYFTWRHSGLDIGNKTGLPIYAAQAGTVKYAGWGRGYGNQVVISHGNGVETRYAHMSKILIDRGEVVEKGQAIGLIGSTGWSTGPHLHFEVTINGKRVNPLNYL